MNQGELLTVVESLLPGGGDRRVTIAVLDGPVDRAHPCFDGADLTVLTTLATQGTAGGRALAHGTHVASVIFGQPGSPVRGIAPFCRGLIAPIFSNEGNGKGLACSQLDLARATLLAIENGAHIINISGGQLTPSGSAEPVLEQAIESCARRNVLIVAAAGNDGCECLHIPAAAPSVLAVGAMDSTGVPLASSNWGAAYRSQGILAPGMDVAGAVPGGGTTRKSGTSFATPIVSGLAARLLSQQLADGKAPDPHAVRAALVKSTLPCLPGTADDCRRFLAGRVNVEGTIKELTGGDIEMSSTETVFQPETSRIPASASAYIPSNAAVPAG